jgi:hypothetical protein
MPCAPTEAAGKHLHAAAAIFDGAFRQLVAPRQKKCRSMPPRPQSIWQFPHLPGASRRPLEVDGVGQLRVRLDTAAVAAPKGLEGVAPAVRGWAAKHALGLASPCTHERKTQIAPLCLVLDFLLISARVGISLSSALLQQGSYVWLLLSGQTSYSACKSGPNGSYTHCTRVRCPLLTVVHDQEHK